MRMRGSEDEMYRARVRGCLLGGAIGDALGGPVEFENAATIRAAHPDGVRRFVAGGNGWPAGTITDDTQLTLFTVEGMIRAGHDHGNGFAIEPVHGAYDRWLDTQLHLGPTGASDGWLRTERWLYARRAPGNTCLTALTDARRGGERIPRYGGQAVNDSKGCGGVMRVAPFGLLPPDTASLDEVFDAAAQAAGFTHGHPTGRLASGALAVIVRRLVDGADLDAALDTTLDMLARRNEHEETSTALRTARGLARDAEPGVTTVERLGGGWVAEDALAIAVYAALVHAGPGEVLDALALAVTHSGDSDSTGAICGNILGARHGETALPPQLAAGVEGRGTILRLADDLVLELTEPDHPHGDSWNERYPGQPR